ncbi:hypothetical protein S7335_1161 [Synechococcus sp. PCC 7335]|uniref:helix-turn-helix domain-containing protein n=1 Tax=Synechococcus sp. (strain ATCC 29403 / PCC 7335) TaxID=91464 RepID=UPI00017EB926|nr:helix-turn-helix transcriptional regulator [Synechococcus sp. PCC 7335]EDX82457.1 hypothetical protein S7335_1161 [Synechococcus sp. PCC 7335]
MQVEKKIQIEVKDLGARIRKARKAHSKSLMALSEEAGINRSYWYDIEEERLTYPLPLATLKKIEAVLGVKFIEG